MSVLIAHGANVHLKYGRETLLHKAIGPAKLGNQEIVKLLLEYGVDPNIKDPCGRSALHLSVQGNAHTEEGVTHLVESQVVASLVELLLMNNANPSLRDDRGLTPFDYLADSVCLIGKLLKPL